MIKLPKIIITEETKQSKGRKVRCPYCDTIDYKPELVEHIEKEHKELIPKGYTAARIVFNIANNKDHGTCVCGCGKETPWREDIWRYDRYATDACLDRYKKQMKQRMINTYGKEHLLNDENMQNKMLSNRSISGTYKFTTGGTVNYVGTYEKKFLIFIDTVMKFRASDIEEPGPVILYKYKNETHKWITDYYIPSFNLVMDIKDGGDNPNNRSMEEYREKQIEKEKAIIEQGKYNYIRLTDNNFAQLMLALAEIKQRMITNENNEYKPYIKINESCIKINHYGTDSIFDRPMVTDKDQMDTYIRSMIECMIGITPNGKRAMDTYIVNYIPKDTYNISWGVTDDPELNTFITTDDNGELKLKNKKYLDEKCCEGYKVYKFNGNKGILNEPPTNIVEMVTNIKIINPDQLEYDMRFENVATPKEMEIIATESYTATLLDEPLNRIPIMTEICLKNTDIMSYADHNGVYIKNESTGLRSKSYSVAELIPKNVVEYIKKGVL